MMLRRYTPRLEKWAVIQARMINVNATTGNDNWTVLFEVCYGSRQTFGEELR